ncbi:MAG: nucleoside hydrolase [Actinomycetota bacterium]
MARPPMLIDCDPGLDDAIALLTAAQLTDLVGITTVNGNVGIDHTTHNALAVAHVSGLDIPVHRGAGRPLLAPTIDAAYVHGATGLGTVEIPEPTSAVASNDAVGFILDMARTVDDLQLVAVGPLTNIALALRRDPSLPERLGGFTIMGGAAHAGNVTSVAEFNVWADPEAAAIVFREFPMTTMVGLDVTHRVLMRPHDRDRLRAAGGPAARLAADLLDVAVERAGAIAGRDGAPIHDATAVMAVVAPDLFRGEYRPVDVELSGTLTRGMTVVDERPGGRAGEGPDEANALVVLDADEQAVVDGIVGAIIALDDAHS